MRQLALLFILASLSLPAFAVYKCDIDGRTVYRDAPCPGGREVAVPASPAPVVDAQKQQAKARAEANRLERERHRRESAQAREDRLAARRAAAQKKKCDSLARRKKWTEEDVARLSGNAQERARVRARRVSEQYAQECS